MGDKDNVRKDYDLITQGLINERKGNFDLALDCYVRCLNNCDEEGDSYGAASSYGNISNIYIKLNDYSLAAKNIEFAKEIFRQLEGCEDELVNCLMSEATLYQKNGDDEKAAQYYNETLSYAKRIDSPPEVVAALHGNLGVLSEKWENFEEAIRHYTHALTIYSECGNRHSEAKALANLGNARFSLEDYSTARNNYQDSLQIRVEIQDRHGEAESLIHLSNIANIFGDFSLQNALLEDANDIRNSLGLSMYE